MSVLDESAATPRGDAATIEDGPIDATRVLARLQQQRSRAPARRRGWLMRRLLVAADIVGLLTAFALAEMLVGSTGDPDALDLSHEVMTFPVTLPLWVLGAKLFGLYDRDEERADHSTSDDFVRVFLLVTVGVFVVMQFAAVAEGVAPDPMKITAFWALSVLAVTAARATARLAGRRSASYLQNTVIVGAGHVGQLIARKLVHHPEYGLRLVGFADGAPRDRLTHVDHIPVLGHLADLPQLVDAFTIDRVIFAFTGDVHQDTLPLVRQLRDSGVQVDMVPRLFEVIGPKIDIHTVEGISLVGLPPVKLARSTRLAKRSVDVVGAGAMLIVTAPFIALIALLIKWSSPGPVFFRQTRLGQGMREFTFLKFRTMRADTDDEAHREYIRAIMRPSARPRPSGIFKLSQEDAVTRIGRWLRTWSLDELPQLINVLRGDMSLVGPRPCMPYEVEHFAAHHFERFLVPAGMTGLWQVAARAHSTFVEALDMDVLYAQSASLGLDLRLLARTPLQLLRSSSTA